MTDDDIREISDALDAEEHPEEAETAVDEQGDAIVPDETNEPSLDDPDPLDDDAEPSTEDAEPVADDPEPLPEDDESLAEDAEPVADDAEAAQLTTVMEPVGGPWAPEPEGTSVFADEPLPGESEMIPLDPVAAAEADAAAAAASDAVATGEPAAEGDTAATGEPAAQTTEPPLMDFGPERRDNAWIWWTLTVIAVLATIGIGVWWYTSLRTVKVPNLVGQKTADAVFAIADLDLVLGDAAEVSTDTVPPGQIVGQKPQAGTQLHPGDTVSLLISKAPETTKVPEVTGKLREDAEETLAKAGLRPQVVQSYSPTAAADYVIGQLPGLDTELPPGSTVALMVSRGPAPAAIRVPNLTGMSSMDAMQLLKSLDLIGLEYRSVDPSKTAGTIASQVPASGSSAKFNERVFFSVNQVASTGTVVVPNATGKKRKDAEKALKDKGLKAQITYVADARIPKDQVIRQMPSAGFKTTKEATVGLLVSRGATETLTVPDVTGKSSAELEQTLDKAGFRAAVVNVRMPGATPGMSLMQFPPAGAAWYYHYPVVVLVGKL